MFMGQYDYAVDAKGRLNFPAKFRDGMGETFIVTRWLDHCLAAFPPEEFEKVAQRIAEKGMVKGRNVSRMLYSSAVEVTPDKQGRIQLPAKLREYANLDHDVSVIGNRNFAEIWNTQDWEARQAESDEDFTAAMEDLDFYRYTLSGGVPLRVKPCETGKEENTVEFSHIPVLLSQCLDGLAIDPAGIYLDGTAGGAGHSKEIAKRLTTGRLISLDQDPDAVATAAARLKGLPAQVVQANFRETARVLDELEIPFINGALLDLGVSSHQLDDAERGFSYHADAPLDMRMSQQGPTAADLVNTLDREELTRILRDYGEEPYAWQIAGKIVKAREEAPILTTLQFADLIASAMPPAERRKNKNPARRSFQAVRIAVNGELDALNEGMEAIFSRLAPGGRFCIITFHSLEDRLVKQKFRRWAQRCTCPPEQPICTCGGMPKAKLITRKPIEADAGELEENRRSRSAKLRVLEKL